MGHQVEGLEIADDDAPLVGTDGEREVLGQLGEQRFQDLGRQRQDRRDRAGLDVGVRQRRTQRGQLGLPRRRDGVRQRRHRAHEGAHGDLGPPAHEARQLGEAGDEVRDEPHDRQIGRAERVTVNVDRHGRQCRGRHRRGRSGRGEQWDGRRQRRRSGLVLAPERRETEETRATDQESRRRTRPRRCWLDRRIIVSRDELVAEAVDREDVRAACPASSRSSCAA